MQKQIEKDILIFSNSTGYGTDFSVDHGSVYANFKNAQDAAWYRSALEYFMNDAYKSDLPTRVNIYKLWQANKKDVYAFDIVEYNLPASGGGDEIPHDDGKCINDYVKEKAESDIDIALNFEAESRVGK